MGTCGVPLRRVRLPRRRTMGRTKEAAHASQIFFSAAISLALGSLARVQAQDTEPTAPALANVMGLQPGSITVTDAGLVIGFVAKPL